MKKGQQSISNDIHSIACPEYQINDRALLERVSQDSSPKLGLVTRSWSWPNLDPQACFDPVRLDQYCGRFEVLLLREFHFTVVSFCHSSTLESNLLIHSKTIRIIQGSVSKTFNAFRIRLNFRRGLKKAVCRNAPAAFELQYFRQALHEMFSATQTKCRA